MNNTRPCVVTGDGNRKPYSAHFHQWATEAYVVEPPPMIGGAPGGQVSFTRAIVEDMDGQIRLVYPSCIKFIKEA